MNNCSNEYEFRVFGLRRSGTHFLISWLISAFDKEEVYYFDNSYNPKRIFGTRTSWKKGVAKNDRRMSIFADKLVEMKMYAPKFNVCDKKCILQAYEDKDLSIIETIDKQIIGKSKRRFNIMILRDPYNWIASRLRFLKRYPRCRALVINTKKTSLWKQYAKEFLGETDTLKDKIVINYDRFCLDESYRSEIAVMLGIVPKIDGNTVLGFGNGSSFIQKKTEKNREAYNKRYLQFKNNYKFMSLISDDELRELSLKIFGKILT